MALLDLQGMELRNGHGGGGHGGGEGGGSSLSVLLCDSAASITLCL
jgi:Lanthionine-containing peptide SapB precursor RamS